MFSEKLEDADSTIRDIEVQHTSEGAILTGTIHQVIPLHFKISGPVSTDGNRVSLTAKEIKADGIPIKGLLTMVGAHLNAVLKLRGMDGIQVEENTLSFSPERVAHLHGVIQSVSTSSEGLTLRYGRAKSVQAKRSAR